MSKSSWKAHTSSSALSARTGSPCCQCVQAGSHVVYPVDTRVPGNRNSPVSLILIPLSKMVMNAAPDRLMQPHHTTNNINGPLLDQQNVTFWDKFNTQNCKSYASILYVSLQSVMMICFRNKLLKNSCKNTMENDKKWPQAVQNKYHAPSTVYLMDICTYCILCQTAAAASLHSS